MRFEIEDDGRITDQAAQWLAALLHQSGRRDEFFAWIAKSPQHVQELTYMLADLRDIASLRPEDIERIEQLAEELGTRDSTPSTVVPISQKALAALEASDTSRDPHESGAIEPPEPASTPPLATEPEDQPREDSKRTLWSRWMIGLAASLVIAAGALWWFTGPGSWQSYTTKIGEQRVLELADGSTVHLNTDSQIAVRLSDTARNVRLLRGEALFSVEHDAKRPFLVRSDEAVIQAIGTRFDVYRRPQGTRVAVIEGLVKISASAEPVPAFPLQHSDPRPTDQTPPSSSMAINGRPAAKADRLLGAGEAADVSVDGQVQHRGTVDAVKVVAWSQRRLVFENDTLENIASEFNRYNAKLKIRVEGSAAAQRFTGTFDADAPEVVMQALAGDPGLKIERVENEILIRDREGALPQPQQTE